MEYLRIRNWEKYQHYKQRKPPWIKVYFALLSDPEFYQLPDASKLHTIAIMLLASQHDNKIKFSKRWIYAAIHANTPIKWDLILSSGFVECYQDASNVLATRKQHACLETETYKEETETEPPIVPHRTANKSNGTFGLFWTAYPRKVGKGAAEKVWMKIHPGNELIDRILFAIATQSKSEQWTRDGGQYIPHPATWLNQRRWEDEPVKEISLYDEYFGNREVHDQPDGGLRLDSKTRNR